MEIEVDIIKMHLRIK